MVAYQNAARGKRSKNAVVRFELNLGDELIQLHTELTNGSYQPGDYASFYIHDPKKRLISAAPFRDRVVHHALCNITVPYFEQQFHPRSFANRIGKGTHAALDECQRLARRFAYVLPCDVRQFFPAIDHVLLQHTLLGLLPHSPSTSRLIQLILQSGKGVLTQEYDRVYFDDDDINTPQRAHGLPIGNLTSQWWANCYLNEIDWFVTRQLRCKGYVRYVDDFLLFSNDQADLICWRAQLIKRLTHLRLTLHEKRAQVRPISEGVSFLGFHIFPSHRRLKRRKGVHFVRKLKAKLRSQNNLDNDVTTIRASITGWINYVAYADTWGLRRTVLKNFDLLADYE